MPQSTTNRPVEERRFEGRDPAVIPLPRQMQRNAGEAMLSAGSGIACLVENSGLEQARDHLRAWLDSRGPQAGGIGRQAAVQLGIDPGLPPEAYDLVITPEGITVSGGSAAGVYYGIQTLIQLARPWDAANGPVVLPCIEIHDAPAFPYRGMHLDVARHFFPVAFIKKYIDLLARYKMNRFHWHLTDDQGWRIEIKKYPRLQEVAAFRKETIIGHLDDQPHAFDGLPYGGYYTQDEVREIVEFAARRHVTIIPEIEMPGHAQAAIAAYPELGCSGHPLEVATRWGIIENVFCPSEQTFGFLQDVLTEVMALFPGRYIHIGGDECPKTQWRAHPLCQEIIRREQLGDEDGLQSYFIRRIERFLNAHNRNLIGWDEILEGGLAPHATVMSWRGERGGIEAARLGHDVIMTPAKHCYFDAYQADPSGEPLAIGSLVPLEKVFHYNPVPQALSEAEARHILGAQGNVWTEYMKRPGDVEYMVFPRLQALAEAVWSRRAERDFEQFKTRARLHLAWLSSEETNVARHLLEA